VLVSWRRHAPVVAPAPEALISAGSLRLRSIFDQTQALAWTLLRRFRVPADRIEDCFQQVFLIASERLDDIRPGSERAFVYGVALRIARTHARSGWREIPEDELDLQTGVRPGADTLLDQRRLVEVCDRILARLTPELREVFVLHEIEGLSGAELAKLLNLPLGTVYSRLRRARICVRTQVEAIESASSATEVSRG
jgi:RNA polymerase sigma-70 factor, ECF subfamily